MSAVKVNIVGTGVRYIMSDRIIGFWDSKQDDHEHDDLPRKPLTTMQIKEMVTLMQNVAGVPEPVPFSFETVAHLHLVDPVGAILSQVNQERVR